MTVPCVAIHGVGNHKEGDIAEKVEATLAETKFAGSVVTEEFNWDKLVEHSGHRGVRDLVWFLEATAENISVAATLGLRQGDTSAQRALGQVQFHVHRVCQWLIALGIGGMMIGAIAQFVMSIPPLLFNLPVGYDRVFRWLPVTIAYAWTVVLTLSAVILGIGILRAATRRRLQPVYESIRSIVLLYLQPILLFLSGPLAIKWTGIALVVWFFGGFTLVVLLISYAFSLSGSETFVYGDTLRFTAYALSASAVLALLQLKVADRWFGTFIKVLLDIIRYLGEPEYRQRVQDALDSTVGKIRSDTGDAGSFVLVSHSLGSIIAVDSLLNSDVWGADDTVHLITMGSPISRMFQRFFPKLLLPDDVGTLSRCVSARVGQFYWLNVYRPFDYIGTSLGLDRCSAGLDVSTGQRTRVFSSHTDYWGDEGSCAVRDTIVSSLESLSPAPKPSQAIAGKRAYVIPRPPARDKLTLWLRSASEPAAMLLFLAIFSGMLWWVSDSLEERNAGTSELISQLKAIGETVSASVHYDRKLISSDKGSTYVHYFTIRHPSKGADGGSQTVKFVFDEESAFPEHRNRFDDRQLTKHIRAHCPSPWWKFWDDGIPCEAEAIQFRFLPDDTDKFDFPDFPPQVYVRDSVTGWIKTAFLSFVLSLFAIVPVGIGGAVFMLLLGHAPFEKKSRIQ